ncbi:MAG: ABC transporter ATP-binding protein, partial [Defluviitaleaceae bacterium]|nr:ABC transporter ATP-binding protein [Defluviitaleaceae bacterium]
KTTYEMMDLITGMAKKNNQTLVIVTHDTEISQYADQIISIRDGNVESITDVAKDEAPAETEEIEAEAHLEEEVGHDNTE